MVFYNILTCGNFASNLKCSIALLGIPILIFIGAFLGKWAQDYNYNKLYGWIGGLGVYLITISITGSAKWSMLFGLAGMGLGGFLLGQWFGGSSDEY
jgi:hypothetical protein